MLDFLSVRLNQKNFEKIQIRKPKLKWSLCNAVSNVGL